MQHGKCGYRLIGCAWPLRPIVERDQLLERAEKIAVTGRYRITMTGGTMATRWGISTDSRISAKPRPYPLAPC
jgi:hypothetical protein